MPPLPREAAWFAKGTLPVLAISGQCLNLSIACLGPDAAGIYQRIVRSMVALGHRRIVFIFPQQYRNLEITEIADVLAEVGVSDQTTAAYHLPEWEETPAGLQALLTEHFRVTPPTALFVLRLTWVAGVLSFLAQRCLRIPADISVVSPGGDTGLTWHRPQLAHIRWQEGALVRRIVRWANSLAHGREDRKTVLIPVEFVEGGSIGRAKD